MTVRIKSGIMSGGYLFSTTLKYHNYQNNDQYL